MEEVKPRIKRYRGRWECYSKPRTIGLREIFRTRIGFGDTPKAAYADWMRHGTP
jgi:hypothetical protein